MQALVVYESMFGNTEMIAKAVAEALNARLATDLVEVGEAPTVIGEDVQLLVVGGPTHAFGLSRPTTRHEAAGDTGQDLVSQGIGLREWLGEVRGASDRVAAAAFDTHIYRPRLPGSAAHAASRRLKHLGFHVVSHPESFYVKDRTGPLVAGEAERARNWAEGLAAVARCARKPRVP